MGISIYESSVDVVVVVVVSTVAVVSLSRGVAVCKDGRTSLMGDA